MNANDTTERVQIFSKYFIPHLIFLNMHSNYEITIVNLVENMGNVASFVTMVFSHR